MAACHEVAQPHFAGADPRTGASSSTKVIAGNQSARSEPVSSGSAPAPGCFDKALSPLSIDFAIDLEGHGEILIDRWGLTPYKPRTLLELQEAVQFVLPDETLPPRGMWPAILDKRYQLTLVSNEASLTELEQVTTALGNRGFVRVVLDNGVAQAESILHREAAATDGTRPDSVSAMTLAVIDGSIHATTYVTSSFHPIQVLSTRVVEVSPALCPSAEVMGTLNTLCAARERPCHRVTLAGAAHVKPAGLVSLLAVVAKVAGSPPQLQIQSVPATETIERLQIRGSGSW